MRNSEERKPWGFCETPEEKCTANYCDENGCQNRKRHMINCVPPKSDNPTEYYTTYREFVYDNKGSEVGELDLSYDEIVFTHKNGKKYELIEDFTGKYIVIGEVEENKN